jgi:hypothetical protein
MKFLLPLLVRFNEAAITLNVETFTDFENAFHIEGTNIPLGPVLKASFSGDVKASLDLFAGKFSMVDSGESKTTADCKTYRFARYTTACREPFLSHTVQEGAGEIFIDATTGKFGVKSHDTATAGGASMEGSFCAVVNVPVKSYPPPSMLKSKINAKVFKRVEDRLNSLPHTVHDGIATFHSNHDYSKSRGYGYGAETLEIHTDGGAPVKAETTGYEPAHRPYTQGWEGGNETFHVIGSASMTFSKWTSPATALASFTGCPDGSTTNLHAHPGATRSLASLNAVVQMMRQHDDLGWLPEDPAAYFMEQIEQQGDEEHMKANATELFEDDMINHKVLACAAGTMLGSIVMMAALKIRKSLRRTEDAAYENLEA